MSGHSFALWRFEIGLGKAVAFAKSPTKGINFPRETGSSFQNFSHCLFPNGGTFRFYRAWISHCEQVGTEKRNFIWQSLSRLFVPFYFTSFEYFDSVIASSTHKSGTNTDPPNQTKELDISTTDSRETDETPASLPPSTSVFNNERPTGATKIERTTFTSSNVTMREKQDDFHTILDDISSTTVAFSPVDNRTVLHPSSKKIGEKQTITVYANVTSFSDVITGKPKHTVISVSRTNERTETTEAINIFNSSSNDFTPVSTKDEPSENKDDSITGSVSIGTIPIPADFDVTDISGTTTSNKITASKNDPERGRTKSISPSKFNGRGDFPISSDHDDSDFNSSESEDVNSLKIFRVKTTSEQSRVYSDKISANGTVSSAESFNESRSNPRTDGVSRVLGKVPWNSSNSTGSRNKPKTPPLDDDFWKYIASSRKVTSTTPAARPGLTSKTKDSNRSKENSMKWRKRGSLNTNVEKNFRWFYNFGYEGQERSRYVFLSKFHPIFLLHLTNFLINAR